MTVPQHRDGHRDNEAQDGPPSFADPALPPPEALPAGLAFGCQPLSRSWRGRGWVGVQDGLLLVHTRDGRTHEVPLAGDARRPPLRALRRARGASAGMAGRSADGLCVVDADGRTAVDLWWYDDWREVDLVGLAQHAGLVREQGLGRPRKRRGAVDLRYTGRWRRRLHLPRPRTDAEARVRSS